MPAAVRERSATSRSTSLEVAADEREPEPRRVERVAEALDPEVVRERLELAGPVGIPEVSAASAETSRMRGLRMHGVSRLPRTTVRPRSCENRGSPPSRRRAPRARVCTASPWIRWCGVSARDLVVPVASRRASWK